MSAEARSSPAANGVPGTAAPTAPQHAAPTSTLAAAPANLLPMVSAMPAPKPAIPRVGVVGMQRWWC